MDLMTRLTESTGMGHRRILAAILFPLSLVFGCVSPSPTEMAPIESMQDFLQTESARNLGPTLQSRLLDLERKAALEEPLDVILGLKAPMTEFERGQLQKAGVQIRSTIGTVATASVPARKIPQIASFKFIAQIELPAQLTPKGGRDEP